MADMLVGGILFDSKKHGKFQYRVGVQLGTACT